MKRLLLVAGISLAAWFILPRAQVQVPDEITHRFSGYTKFEIELSGLDALQHLPRRVVVEVRLPAGFRLDVPTDYSATVDGAVEVDQK